MDFRKLLMSPVHAGQAVVRGLQGDDQSAARDQVMQFLAQQAAGDVKRFTPEGPSRGLELPSLDDSLSESGLARKAELEAAGEPFVPDENDFTDAGPYGYLHKKKIHDALLAYEQELNANRPHIDYEGILKQRLADIAAAPEEHRTNPLFTFAMAMGNPEHARELVGEYKKSVSDANTKQAQRWKELLDMKQQALEGSIKQSMAEGDSRKIVAGKWLEQLAQIEQDKAALAGKQQIQDTKDEAAERRTILRGEWANTVAGTRASAMLTAAGIKQDSTTHRSLTGDARALMQSLLKRGTDFSDAQDMVEDWLSDQIAALKNTPQMTGATSVPTPQIPAPGTASTNPMEAEIQRARGGR